MFERFSEQARQVVVIAQEEARALLHNYIGTEHLLLGLLHEDETVAAHVLSSLGVTLAEARAEVVTIVGAGQELTAGQIPFTPRAKRVLEISLREALALGHDYIGTEHLLLALVREEQGVGARVLADFDADAGKVRTEVIRRIPQSERRTGMNVVPPVRVSQLRFTLAPDSELRRLLMAAAGRALEDQREEFGLADLLAVAEQAADEQAADEQATDDQAADDQAADEQAADEQAGGHQAGDRPTEADTDEGPGSAPDS